MTRPDITQATVGYPASDAWWNAQVYDPINWLYGQMWTEIYKTSDTTRTTSTFADDPDFQVALDASSVYRIEMFLHFAAIDAARFKTQWNVPSGASGNRSAIGPDQGQILSGTSSGGTGRWGVHGFATDATYGSRDSAANQCFAMEEATVFTSSAGTLALQWCQATTNATATKLAAGSYMRVKKLA
ncbi:hypothetical protein [Streptomyces sp. MUM 16J]|uniref:hypothetical protein n=1 Tax=Streptomyces sp. MUM 16J TaxID=2791988 RepID=UPI001F03EB9A|nr:hypothetical protein [Streptomyces sp. MUM 16J]MCH0555822.1 hypothetical protein [Streptomyces sp. MUM 16J]